MSGPRRALWTLTWKAHGRRLLAWPLAWTALVLALASATRSLYPDGASRLRYASTIGSSRIQELFNGRGYDLTSAGGIEAFEVGMFGLVLVPVGASLLAVRLMRAEEALGRWEVVSAGGYGKTAPTAAAMAAQACSTALFGAASFAGLLLFGFPAAGAAKYCLILCLFGLVFAAAAALLAQTVADAKAAGTAVLAWVMFCYLVRAAIDGRRLPATWLTPMGWLAEARPWGTSRLWPYAACATAAAALAAAALALCRVRDLGGAAVSPRPGRAGAAPWIRGTRYVWRLTRSGAAGWCAAAVCWAAPVGAMGDEIDVWVEQNPGIAELFGGHAPRDFMSVLAVGIIGLLALAAGLATAAELRGEEASGRLGLVCSTRCGYASVVRAWFAQSALAAAAVAASGGFAYWISIGASTGKWELSSSLGAAALLLVPIVAVLAGAFAVFSYAPKAWAAVWALACWIAVVEILADPLDLPEWGRKLSPLYLVGRVPMESPSWIATGCIGAAALALALAGVKARPRDLAAG